MKCLNEQSTTGACLTAHYFVILINHKGKKNQLGHFQTIGEVNSY